MFKGGREVTERLGNIILMIVHWDSKIMREKGEGARCSLSSFCWDITSVVVVMVWRLPNVPGINTVLCQGSTLFRCFIRQCFYARWGHWSGMVVKDPIHANIDRHMGVLVGSTQHIEGILALRYKAVPKM